MCVSVHVWVLRKRKRKNIQVRIFSSYYPPAPLLPDIFTHMAWLVVRAERWDKETDNA